MVVTVGAVVVSRAGVVTPMDDVDPALLDDYNVAVLNGGPELATVIALLNLDRTGAVELGDRLLRQLAETNALDTESLTEDDLAELGIGMEVNLMGDLPPGAHPVEAAVYQAVVDSPSRRPRDIRSEVMLGPTFNVVRSGLVELGLLTDLQEQWERSRQWRWFVPLIVLGLLRFGYGVARGRPVLFLLLLIGATVAAMVVVARRGSDRTSRGTRALEELRLQEADEGDAVRVLALNGTAPLWETNRPLALAVDAGELRRGWSSRSDGGGWYGWGACGAYGAYGAGCGSDGGGGGGGGCGG